MGALRYLTYGLIAVSVMLFSACGGQDAAVGTQQAFEEWTASMPTGESGAGPSANGLPGIPYDTDEPGRAVSAEGGGSIEVLGKDYILQLNSHVDGTFLVMESPGIGGGDAPPIAFGLYQVSGLLDKDPKGLAVQCIPEFGDEYYVGVADYTEGRWIWFGPAETPEFYVDLDGHRHRFVTPLGNMYFIVIVEGGDTATHRKTVVLFGERDHDELPGAPHHLVASDGEFAGAVGVWWEAGGGASHYQLFRRVDGHESEWEMIAQTEATEYLDENVEADVVYLYKARAVNEHGTSGFSNIDAGWAGGGGGHDWCIIEGRIASDGGEGFAGIAVALLGLEEVIFTETGPEGVYRFGELEPGLYIVAPQHAELAFDPQYKVVELGGEECFAVANFTAWLTDGAHRIRGFVYTFEEGEDGGIHFSPMGGVLVKAWHDSSEEFWATETNLDGFFGFFEMPEGAFRVQPFKEGWVFTPEMHDTFLNGLEVPNWLFFRGHRDGGGGGECVIEGRVSHPEGEGWGGVTLKLIGLDQIIATETGPDGGFRFGELPPGWYLVVAYHHELDFAPYVAVADLSGEQCFAEVNFNAWASEDLHRIYGVVYTFSDDGFGQNGLLPLWDTTVKAKLIDTNEVWETMTGDLGLFILHGLPEGGYLVSPHKEGWFFTPEVEDAHVNGLELPWPMFFTGHRGDI